MATDTMSLVEQCQEILRRTGGQASTAFATLMLSCQMNVANAQTAPVSPAESAIATAAKGLEYWQYTKDGRKLEDLKPEDIKGLNDHDYDIYNEWKIANKQATIKSIMQEIANKQATIKSIMQENKLLDARIMTEYKKMIINFTTLHAARSQAPIYFTIKNDLKNILLTGKPPEILPQLEPLQSILMP